MILLKCSFAQQNQTSGRRLMEAPAIAENNYYVKITACGLMKNKNIKYDQVLQTYQTKLADGK